jgi:hypothetical protein
MKIPRGRGQKKRERARDTKKDKKNFDCHGWGDLSISCSAERSATSKKEHRQECLCYSVGAEGDYGVDGGGATGWEKTSEERDQEKEKGNGSDRG